MFLRYQQFLTRQISSGIPRGFFSSNLNALTGVKAQGIDEEIPEENYG